MTAAGVVSHMQRGQCCIFLHVAGEEAQKVHVNTTFTTAEQDLIEPLMHAFWESQLHNNTVPFQYPQPGQRQ